MSSLKKFLFDNANQSEIDKYFEDQAAFYLTKRKMERIDNFNGYFDFLNNEYPCAVYYDGNLYKTVYHAYQAARTDLIHIREKIKYADTLAELFEIAAQVEDSPDWTHRRLKVMEMLIRDKFRRHKDLRERLATTGSRELINSYADPSPSNLFWGVVDGKGQNQLGRILENVRADIKSGDEPQKWLFFTFKLQDDRNFIPNVTIEITRNSEPLDKITLEHKSFHLIGKLKTNGIILEHESISRVHAAIIIDEVQGLCLVDLGSKAGTFIEGKKVEPHLPFRLTSEQLIGFGLSSRRYRFFADYTEVSKRLQLKSMQIEQEKLIMEKLNDSTVKPEVLKAALGLYMEDTIFVGNLPESGITSQEVRTFFSRFGDGSIDHLLLSLLRGRTPLLKQ
eukprot:TRINITY_DN2586_c0_g4_i5.p1 TRINITY_DN2586_c0_g4~~TRINITY_DN2586_c0_g4_i5.p1  ORF type:complete len:393 (-),score=64.20 TRINITY_DN2586_c0_g4_i5:615-1793(-)